jgi:cobalamin biosynthesis Co2+ chelatase CbiK
MQALTDKTRRIVERLFPRDQHDAVRELLVDACGATLPFAGTLRDAGIERVRLAVLKLSEGDLAKLYQMAGYASVDWRDVLVWAGFGESLAAHSEWARDILDTRSH